MSSKNIPSRSYCNLIYDVSFVELLLGVIFKESEGKTRTVQGKPVTLLREKILIIVKCWYSLVLVYMV